MRLQLFVPWFGALIDQLVGGALDAAVINRPEEKALPSSLASELIATEAIVIVAGKSTKLSKPSTLEEISSHSWLLNPQACGIRQILETAFRQRGLTLSCAVESEGYDLKLTLIADGVGVGLVKQQLYRTSSLRKNLKIVKVKEFAPKVNVWLLHSKHLGRLAPAVQCLRDSVQKSLKARNVGKIDEPASA